MQQLLPIINKLQDVTASVGPSSAFHIDLPQIAVVGCQSAGKSSVLESIVGRDFLPRGQGIITRRPLILQLRQALTRSREGTQKGDDQSTDTTSSDTNTDDEDSQASESTSFTSISVPEVSALATLLGKASFIVPRSVQQFLRLQDNEYGEFSHLPGQKFHDFGEIRREIEKETDRVAGKDKGISHKPILLRITSPRVIDLTLVDLPGLAKNPVGDQPEDIESQIREMICSYVTKPNCLILAVTPATTDLATSDALKIAREADPQGERTIGVLTKCDLLEEGTSAQEILGNQILPLKLGYIAMVCRSQKNVKQNISIREALSKEKEYFAKHPAYKPFAKRCGTANLVLLLNKILLSHIKKVLPSLKSDLQEQIFVHESALRDLGEPCTDPVIQRAHLLQFFTDFAHQFSNVIDGRITRCPQDQKPQKTLKGGARIAYIFHEVFGNLLEEYVPNVSEDEIRVAIRRLALLVCSNSNGPRVPLLGSEGAFQELVQRQIMKLESLSIDCVHKVHAELRHIAEHCEIGIMSRLPNLRRESMKIIEDMLQGCLMPTVDIVHKLFKWKIIDKLRRGATDDIDVEEDESCKIFISGGTPKVSFLPDSQLALSPPSIDYDENRSDLPNLLPVIPADVRPAGRPDAHEQNEIELIAVLQFQYFTKVVRPRIVDSVPKAIVTFLINEAIANVQQELTKHLFKEDLLQSLMTEDEEVESKRKFHEEALQFLRTSLGILDTVRDHSLNE